MRAFSVFGAVVLNMLVRWGLLLVGFVGLTAIFADAKWSDTGAYHIGSKPLVYDWRALDVLEPKHRIEVVSAELEDGRGVVVLSCSADPAACFHPDRACQEQVVVADAWDALSVLCADREGRASLWRRASALIVASYRRALGQGPPESTEARWQRTQGMAPICPEAACASLDYGGLAKAHGGVLSAQRRLGRVTMLPFRADVPPQPAATADVQLLARSHSPTSSGTVHDVASTGGSQFVVSESIEPDRRDPTPVPLGRLYLGTIGRKATTASSMPAGQPRSVELSMSELLTAGLARPLGVAFSSIPNRLYVADSDETSLRWSYYDRGGSGEWVRHTFWSIKRESEQAWPELQHMVVVKIGTDEMVIAAGPDGLYVLHPDDGQLIARIALGAPVQGLAIAAASSGQWLYMTIGRRYLGRLQLKVAEVSAAEISSP